MGFIVKVVLALIVIASCAWTYMTYGSPVPAPITDTTQKIVTPQLPPPAPTVDDGGISASGNTDAALQSDLSALDTQAQSAQSLSVEMDSSFNDKPIDQTE